MNVMEYFRDMSPLAGRISDDVTMTRNAYKELWDTLSETEREQVINETLIDPAVILKYNSALHNADSKLKPISKFSWFTKSQLSLCGLEQEKADHARKRSPSRKGPAPEPPGPRVQIPSPVPSKVKRQAIASPPCEPNNLFCRLKSRRSEEKQPLVETHSSTSVASSHPAKVSKPKTPPPPPPSETHALLSVDEIDLSIPKTGFDFLDNW